MSLPGTPKTAAEIQQDWDTNPRWNGLTRNYSAEQVSKLQGNVVEEHTLARRGSEILWDLVNNEDYINSLGALTGNQAVQQVRAGLKAIYLSGWQVAGDANLSGHTYPDQSLYPANSVPAVVRRINNALLRADEIAKVEGDDVGQELARPDRGRRRGRLRWRPERLRAAEGHDRGRRRRCALGRPARFGEEVRPPRWQGADPHPAAHPHPDLRASGRRRRRRAFGRSSPAPTPRPPPSSPPMWTSATASSSTAPVPPRASSASRTASSPASRVPRPTPRTPTSSGWRPVSRISRSRASSPSRFAASSRTSCWPTTARLRSTGRQHLDDATIAKFQT